MGWTLLIRLLRINAAGWLLAAIGCAPCIRPGQRSDALLLFLVRACGLALILPRLCWLTLLAQVPGSHWAGGRPAPEGRESGHRGGGLRQDLPPAAPPIYLRLPGRGAAAARTAGQAARASAGGRGGCGVPGRRAVARRRWVQQGPRERGWGGFGVVNAQGVPRRRRRRSVAAGRRGGVRAGRAAGRGQGRASTTTAAAAAVGRGGRRRCRGGVVGEGCSCAGVQPRRRFSRWWGGSSWPWEEQQRWCHNWRRCRRGDLKPAWVGPPAGGGARARGSSRRAGKKNLVLHTQHVYFFLVVVARNSRLIAATPPSTT